MSALAGLVERGLVAADWAAALAPVDDKIAAMGRLPARGAGRRPGLPARRRPRPAGVRAPAGRRTRAGRGAGPLSHAGAPDRAVVRRGAGRATGAALARQHLHRAARRTSGSRAGLARRPVGLGRPGRHAAQPRAHSAARRSRRRTGGVGGRTSPRVRSPRWPRAAVRASRSCGAATRSRSSRCWARSRGWSRCTRRRCRASRGFFGSRPFSRVNRMLEEQGAEPVDWQLPQGI